MGQTIKLYVPSIQSASNSSLNENEPQPSSVTLKRKDSRTLRNALLSSLDKKGSDYWTMMKRFLQGKINRVEMDVLCMSLLSAQHGYSSFQSFCVAQRLEEQSQCIIDSSERFIITFIVDNLLP